MKILNISPVMPEAWNFGGSVITSHALISEMVKQNHVISWITSDAQYHSKLDVIPQGAFILDGIPTYVCKLVGPAPPFWSPELRPQVRRQASQFDIALIRSCWTYWGIGAGKECRRAGLPYLAYPEGSLSPWGLGYFGAWKNWPKAVWWHLLGERSYFQGSKAIVALNKHEYQEIRAWGLRNRIEVIPNGVNMAEFDTYMNRTELENTWGKLKNRRWLLFLGRLHPIKGLDLLLPAFARLARQYPDYLLVIAGPDENGYARHLTKLAADLDIAEHVLFLGPAYGTAKIGLLREAELFLLTSYTEGFPMALLEAMGCGTPALITQGCHVPEVAEAEAGLVVEADVDRIARSLRELLNDAGARRIMGDKARRLVESHFTWDQIARQTAELCHDIIHVH